MKPKTGPERVDTVLAGLLERFGLNERLEQMGAVGLWPEIVGEQMARVTRARTVDDGALIVEVRNSAWLMELNMMKGEILVRVNERVPDTPLNRIVFVQAETE